MAMNPLGYVPVFDFGAPKLITAYALGTISGGQFVCTSGLQATVTSGISSFVATDLIVYGGCAGSCFTGIAMQNVTSGNPVAVAIEGAFILPCGGSVRPGEPIKAISGDSVGVIGSNASAAGTVDVEDGGTATLKIGRAISPGESGDYAIVYINP